MRFSLLRRKDNLPNCIGKENSDSTILFVHGLGGQANTWVEFSELLSSQWVEVDSFDMKYEEYYPLKHWINRVRFVRFVLKWVKVLRGPNITNLSTHLSDFLDRTCENHDNIIIIAHSMGGLVARKYILEKFKKEQTVGKVKGLITYATPHEGSLTANYVNIVFFVLTGSLLSKRIKQVLDLRKGSAFITSLNSEWRDLRISEEIDFLRVVGIRDTVVDIQSSSYTYDANAKWVYHDHKSIIRPFSSLDDSFIVTYDYLKKFRKKLEEKAQLSESAELASEEENADL